MNSDKEEEDLFEFEEELSEELSEEEFERLIAKEQEREFLLNLQLWE